MHRLFRARLSLAFTRLVLNAENDERSKAKRTSPPRKSLETISFASSKRLMILLAPRDAPSKYWKREGRGTSNADNKIPRCDEQMQPSKRIHRLRAGIHRCIFSSPRATLNSLSPFLSLERGGPVREVVDRSSDTRGAGAHELRVLRAIAPRVRFRLSGHFVNGAVSRNKQKCAVAAALRLISSFLRGSSPAARSPAPTPPLFSSPLASPSPPLPEKGRVEKRCSFSSQSALLRRPFFPSFLHPHIRIPRRSTIMMDDKNFIPSREQTSTGIT